MHPKIWRRIQVLFVNFQCCGNPIFLTNPLLCNQPPQSVGPRAQILTIQFDALFQRPPCGRETCLSQSRRGGKHRRKNWNASWNDMLGKAKWDRTFLKTIGLKHPLYILFTLKSCHRKRKQCILIWIEMFLQNIQILFIGVNFLWRPKGHKWVYHHNIKTL